MVKVGIFEEGKNIKCIKDIFRANRIQKGRIYKVIDIRNNKNLIYLVKRSKKTGKTLKETRNNLVTITLEKANGFDKQGRFKKANGEKVKIFKKTNRNKPKNNNDKSSRRKNKTADQVGIEKGDILYAMWGYDQTNIDFIVVEEISDSGKTFLARRMSSKFVETDKTSKVNRRVVPNKRFGETFRVQIKDDNVFRGTYPMTKNGGTRLGTFRKWDGDPKLETSPGFGH